MIVRKNKPTRRLPREEKVEEEEEAEGEEEEEKKRGMCFVCINYILTYITMEDELL